MIQPPLENGPARAHSRDMAKKRGGIADGIKAAYHIHQALEAVQSVTASKVREFIEGLKEIALMVATPCRRGRGALADNQRHHILEKSDHVAN